MSNYYSDGIEPVSFTADVDLTSWQYRLVGSASTGGNVNKWDHLSWGTASPMPIGVLLNDPSAGQEASVKPFGFAKTVIMVGPCTANPGSWMRGGSNGTAEPASVLTSAAQDAMIGRYFGTKVTTTGSFIGQIFFSPVLPISGSALPSAS